MYLQHNKIVNERDIIVNERDIKNPGQTSNHKWIVTCSGNTCHVHKLHGYIQMPFQGKSHHIKRAHGISGFQRVNFCTIENLPLQGTGFCRSKMITGVCSLCQYGASVFLKYVKCNQNYTSNKRRLDCFTYNSTMFWNHRW